MNELISSGTVPAPRNPLLHLFLVEDSATLRELLLEAIAAIPGIVIDGFSDSEDDAFQQLHHTPCDIVIVDIQLKQGNGITLLRRLAAQASKPQMVNIVLSNNVSPAYRRVIDEFDVCFFFDKTTEFTQLQLLLHKLGAGAS